MREREDAVTWRFLNQDKIFSIFFFEEHTLYVRNKLWNFSFEIKRIAFAVSPTRIVDCSCNPARVTYFYLFRTTRRACVLYVIPRASLAIENASVAIVT